MKGWRHESLRHSLAARGIKTNPAYAKMGISHMGSSEWWASKHYWVFAKDDFDEDEIDIPFELEIAERIRHNWHEMWDTNDIDLNYLKKSMTRSKTPRSKIQMDEPSMNIVFYKTKEDIGAGSGDLGSAKVFWLPYSYPDRDKIMVYTDFGNESARVLAHELSHGYGFDVEFVDYWNDAVAYKTLIEMGVMSRPMRLGLNGEALRILAHSDREKKSKYYLEGLHLLRYLYRTFGEKIMSGYMLDALRYPEEVQRLNEIMRKEITGKFGRGAVR